MAIFAAMVPKVMIWATRFIPYFSTTQLSTLSLPSSSKSISISGREILSGLRKRSNNKLYFNGSISVILFEYATTDPAADPRPGPTTTSISRAAFKKSWTIRKYPGYPIFFITESSKSILSLISSVNSSYLSLAPS
ncbi:hypothetical protein ES708_29458 [subsurface metagenome]